MSDPEWAMRTLAATLADTVDAYEAVLWLSSRLDRDESLSTAPAAVARGVELAEAWDRQRRALEADRG